MKENIDLTKAQFACILIKDEDGSVKVVPFSEEGVTQPDSLDDVYNACNTIMRNIDQQQQAAAVSIAMLGALKQAQGKTDSGVILPR